MPLLVSFLFGLPACIVLPIFLYFRQDSVTHNISTIGLVFLAATWMWIGPVFIWRYEHITATTYWMMYRKVVDNRREFYRLRGLVSRTSHGGIFGQLFVLFWCSLVLVAFVSSYDFMKGFGITSRQDIWWYIQIAGVAIQSYFSGLGFVMVIRTFFLIKEFLSLTIKIDPYNPDGVGGLGFFGALLSQTSLMFASGSLYIPILIKLYIELFSGYSFLILVIIGLYALMIAISFVAPAWLVHKKILIEKIRAMTAVSSKMSALKARTQVWSLESYLDYRVKKDEYMDIRGISPWPFDVYNVMTVLSSITLPIVLTIAQIELSE